MADESLRDAMIQLNCKRSETPEGTGNLCRYVAAHIRDRNRERHDGNDVLLLLVSMTLDAAAKHLARPEQ